MYESYEKKIENETSTTDSKFHVMQQDPFLWYVSTGGERKTGHLSEILSFCFAERFLLLSIEARF